MTPLLLLPPLVDVDMLEARLDEQALRIFDATVYLQRPSGGGPYAVVSGQPQYELAHIPGAGFADIPGKLSDPDARRPFTLPTPEHFAAVVGAMGIGPGTHVVAYSQTTPMWATRLWWLLRHFGHAAVSVLDGGMEAWRAAGLPLSDRPASYPAVHFTPNASPSDVASRDEIEAVVAAGGEPALLVNALTAPVFRGEGVTSYSRPGRIPHSINLPWTDLVDPDTNRFRPREQLRRALAPAIHADRDVIAYCGGGISATVDLFALSQLGLESARLYDGSLAEWTADPSLPLDVG